MPPSTRGAVFPARWKPGETNAQDRGAAAEWPSASVSRTSAEFCGLRISPALITRVIRIHQPPMRRWAGGFRVSAGKAGHRRPATPPRTSR